MRINLHRHVRRLDYFGSIWCRCRARSPRLRTIKLSGFPSPTVSVYELYLLILASLLSRNGEKREESENSLHSFQICCRAEEESGEVMVMDGEYILHSDYVCAGGDSGRMVTEIYEFWTLPDDELFGTHITSQPVQSAQPAERASCWTLGTRKCCWAYRAWRAESRDGWRSHADPSTHRRRSEFVLSRCTKRRWARGVLRKKMNESQKRCRNWNDRSERKIKNSTEFCILKRLKSLEARRSAWINLMQIAAFDWVQEVIYKVKLSKSLEVVQLLLKCLIEQVNWNA